MAESQCADQKKQDDYLLSNVRRLFLQAEEKHNCGFTAFLDERQQALISGILKKEHGWLLSGGMKDCERQMLGVFPAWMEPTEQEFPISVLKLTVKGKETLNHRDYLGALMALQIKREAVGDIVPDEKGAYIFIKQELLPFLLQSFDRVGRASILVEEADVSGVLRKQEKKALTGTVSSLRLDCVVAMLLNQSRSTAVELIRSGAVRLNYLEEENISRQLSAGDVLSIRGKGKFILGSEFKKTKKDRIFLTVEQLL